MLVVYNDTFDLFFVVQLWCTTSFSNVISERVDTSFPNVISKRVDASFPNVRLRHFRTC